MPKTFPQQIQAVPKHCIMQNTKRNLMRIIKVQILLKKGLKRYSQNNQQIKKNNCLESSGIIWDYNNHM